MRWLKSVFTQAGAQNVLINPAGIQLVVLPGETILEQALKAGAAYPHDCTVGTCGACRTRLISGTVDALTPFGYTLSRDEIEAGYILACQAVPKTELVVEVELQTQLEEHVTTKAKLVETTLLTHDIIRVVWEAELPMHYRAGQYINVRWNNGEVNRSYSLAAAPEKSGQTRLVTFIRHVPGGAFTDGLFSGKAQTFSYELDGPHGQFWLRAGKGPMLCIAGGSGLAPIVSLLEDAANKRTRRDCVLLFGGRSKRDLYCAAEIAAVRTKWTAGFDFWPVLSETPEPDLRSGMVTAHIFNALERLGPDTQAYLCGPPAMIDAAIAELVRLGVRMDSIFNDKFTDASSTQK